MSNVLSPTPKQQFFDNNGRPAVGYKLFTYEAGTTTKLATYVSESGSANANPIVLDYRGSCNLWVPPNVSYKYVLAPPSDTDPPTAAIWSTDDVVSSQLITLYGGVDTGSANAYVLTFDANFSAYQDGIIIYWVPANTNTLSVPTINVNGLGAVNIVNSNGSSLNAGTIVAGQITQIMYLSGSFKILNTLPITGTFTGTLTGIDAVVTGTCDYSLTGRIAAVRIPATLVGTSNANTCTITGMPAFLSPSGGMVTSIPTSAFLNNSATVSTVRALVSAASPGTITFQLNGSSTGFTASNTKGVDISFVITWMLP